MNNYIASTVLMVSPDQFDVNIETIPTNTFAKLQEHISPEEIKKIAMEEFNLMVNTLRNNNIEVLILPSRKNAITPDSIFANNWVSHHEDGTLVIYPMFAVNRRAERQVESLLSLLAKHTIPANVIDLSKDEERELFLEGTGSLVLDRKHKVAFALGSKRTSREEFHKWCDLMNYSGVFFYGYDRNKIPIYQTALILAVTDSYAIVCFDSIEDPNEKHFVKEQLEKLNKDIIEISLNQAYAFCANVIQLQTKQGEKVLFLSQNALRAFDPDQKSTLEKHNRLVPIKFDTIETIGGGSVHCIIEIFK